MSVILFVWNIFGKRNFLCCYVRKTTDFFVIFTILMSIQNIIQLVRWSVGNFTNGISLFLAINVRDFLFLPCYSSLFLWPLNIWFLNHFSSSLLMDVVILVYIFILPTLVFGTLNHYKTPPPFPPLIFHRPLF